LVVGVEPIASVAVTAIAAWYIVTNVLTAAIVLFAFIHICTTTQNSIVIIPIKTTNICNDSVELFPNS